MTPPIQLESNAPKEEGKKPEVIDVRIDAKKIVIDKMQTDIRLANANLKSVEAELTPKAQEYLQNYFHSSIDRFDADKDGKISKEESEIYQAAMFAKIKSLIDEYAPTEEQKKALEAKNAAAKAVEAPKLTSEESAEISKNLGEIKEISGNLDLASSKKEFESLQTQNNSFQSSISESITKIQSFHTSVANFQKAQQGWQAFSHAWDEFKHPLSQSAGAKKEKELEADVAAAKVEGNKKLDELKSKKAILDSNSEKIKAAFAAERVKIIKDRDAKIAEMQSTGKDQSEKIVEKKKKYDEIRQKQEDLIKQQKTLEDKQKKQAEFQKNWTETKEKEQWEYRQKAFEVSGKDAAAEMAALKIILDDPHLTPEMKDKIQKEYDTVASRQKVSETNLNLVTERITNGKAVERQLTEDEKANLDQIHSVTAYMKGHIEPALTSTTNTVAKLEELKLQYATQSTEVADYYNKKVEQIDKINESVSDYALASAVGRDKSISALEMSVKSLDSLDIDNRGILRSALGIPQGYLHGMGEAGHDFGAWIDKNTGFVLDNSSGGWHLLAQTTGFFTGFVSGGVELVGGVMTMAAHPWETAKGLTALVGYDAQKGEWSSDTLKSTWKHLVSTLLGGDEWEKKHYGTSAGKAVFNVASFFVGAGEAKAAGEAGMVGRAASAASKARVAKVAQAVSKGASESWMLGRGAQIAEFAKTLAIEATPKFIKKASVAGSEEVGVLGKTGAVLKSFRNSITGYSPKFITKAREAGQIAKEAGKSRIWAITKSVGELPFNIYKLLLMSPVSLVRATAHFIQELPKLARRIRSEGLVNVYRASKLSKVAEVITAESGRFAKAREAMAEIIEKDPKLSLLSQEGEAGARAAEAQASIKLLRENPTLFDAYTKMEKATAELNEHAAAMAEDIKSNIKKIKENPEVKYEVAEHNRLKANYEAAKAKYEKAPTPDAALESEMTRAEKNLKTFERDPKRMDKVDQLAQAVTAEKELTSLLKERTQLRDQYIGAPKEALARLEREVGEARAVRDGKITAVTDTPEFIAEARANFEKAIKSGNVDEIEKATNAFGTFEPNSELSKMMEAIQRKISGKPVPKYTRTKISLEFYQQNTYKAYVDALKNGKMEEIAAIRKTPDGIRYSEFFDYMDYKYYSETADLRTVFQRNQKELLTDYELYQKALQDPGVVDSFQTREALHKKHPAWQEAFNELDSRQNYLLHNDVITHRISAIQIKIELPDIIKPGMKAEEAASKLRKHYAGQSLGADLLSQDVSEISLQGKTYRVRLEADGDINLIAPDRSIVPTLEEVAAKAKAAKAGGKAAAVEATAPRAAEEAATEVVAESAQAEAKITTQAPEKPATMRRDEALELLNSSKKELKAYQKALREQQQNLQLAEETYLQRKASGKFSDKALEGMKNKMEAAKELVAKSQAEISRLEEIVSTSRKDKWVARAEVAGTKTFEYAISPLRSKWVEKIVERLKSMPGLPGKIANALATFLKEQVLLKYLSIRLLSKKGLGLVRQLKFYWDQTHDRTRPLSRLYNEILDDQLILLGQLSKSVAKNLNEFKSLPVSEKMAKVEAGWNQLALGGSEISHQEMYSDAELDYLQDKKTAVRAALDSIKGREGITATDVQNAIDEKLGPAGNDTNKSYTISIDDVKIKVDQDGRRTYEGLEKWVVAAHNERLAEEAARELASKESISEEKLAHKPDSSKAKIEDDDADEAAAEPTPTDEAASDNADEIAAEPTPTDEAISDDADEIAATATYDSPPSTEDLPPNPF